MYTNAFSHKTFSPSHKDLHINLTITCRVHHICTERSKITSNALICTKRLHPYKTHSHKVRSHFHKTLFHTKNTLTFIQNALTFEQNTPTFAQSTLTFAENIHLHEKMVSHTHKKIWQKPSQLHKALLHSHVLSHGYFHTNTLTFVQNTLITNSLAYSVHLNNNK